MSAAEPTGFVAGAECPMNAASIEEAVSGICASAPKVRATTSYDRAAILDRLAAAVAAEGDAMARALAEESGYLTFRDMQLEVQRAVEVFTLTSACVRVGLSETLNVDAVDRARGAVGYVRREPKGPVLGITAYNGPLLIPAHKIAPAIGAGAPIVIKPSPRVPRSAIWLAKAAVAAGWPAEAIAVLDADNAQTEALIRDPRLPVISFTGGDFGWTIKDMVPRKHVHLELGGVGAVYVAEDGNLDLAARECAAGGFVRSGQSCISVQRIYVHQAVYDDFVETFRQRVEELTPTDPAAPAIGPMVSEAAAGKVMSVIDDAVAKGARVVCGGTRSGPLVRPTLLAGARPEMTVMRAEVFGPVVAVCPVAGLDEAIAEMNAVSGAIHHGIYSSDIDAAFAAADRIRAGGVIINGPGTWRVDHMPYGGTGTSGFGREGVRYAIEELTEPKVIIVRPSRP